ncbi:MAG: hypothetical protein IPK78_15535 [Rhodospirillales bacterium]|nr:hypothetical protein [Rhodospirillales bacterium]
MSDEKQRSEDAMGKAVGTDRTVVQGADETAMGRSGEAASSARAAAQVAMGQPATTEQAAAQQSDEAAVGAPATAAEMAARVADDQAMGTPSVPGQRREQALDEVAMGQTPPGRPRP